MRRVIVALEMRGLEATPELHAKLRRELKSLLSCSGSRLIDVRVARKRVEVDLLTDDVQGVVSKLSSAAPVEYFRMVGEAEPEPFENSLRLAVTLFNDERFWEAHETLENVWHRESGPRRAVLSGLIKLAAAHVHFQKGNVDNYFRLLEAAENHLAEWSDETLSGIDIKRLRGEIESVIKARSPKLFSLSM